MSISQSASFVDSNKTSQHPWKLRSWLSSLDSTAPSSSNIPSLQLPFQRWFKFKEAFAPNIILDCLNRLDYHPETCLDPFGGCGTTALTCQFAGISPTLIEVNPFIADLAESKLASYDLDELQRDYLHVRQIVRKSKVELHTNHSKNLPPTLCEPGYKERWVYPINVFSKLIAYRNAINSLENKTNSRLLRVLLGSILVETSNVIVNGKGRKYRDNWKARQKTSEDVDKHFEQACLQAMQDLQAYSSRSTQAYTLLRGSCLEQIDNANIADFSIFSPPYPNSFDYTDIYNLELWVLGYLSSKDDNLQLRAKTLRSHVQITMSQRGEQAQSETLEKVLKSLNNNKSELWSPRIPDMVSGYFSDLQILLGKLQTKVRPGGGIFTVVGDSSYCNITVPVGKILLEIAESSGYSNGEVEALRQMRFSAQQGGHKGLDESLVHLTV